MSNLDLITALEKEKEKDKETMQESKVIHNNITIEFNYINIERKR